MRPNVDVATAVLVTVLIGLVAVAPASASAAGPSAGLGGAATTQDCAFPVEVTDTTGTNVTLEERPDEVVVTAQSAAQMAWELDAQDRVTGMPVGPFSAYLNGSQNKTDITNQEGFVDAEQVIDLDPDLVIAPNVTSVDTVRQLRDAGLTVYHFSETASIEEVKGKTTTVGRLLGSCDAAGETTDWMDEEIEAVEERTPDEDVSVLYWMQGGFTAGSETFQHDLLETAGGENIAATAGISGYQAINEEQIVEQDPAVLVINDYGEIPDNEAIQSTSAVQNDRVVRVDGNLFSQPAPRIVIALRQLAEGFHPEAFSEDEETNESTSDEGSDDGSSESTDGTEDGTSDSDSEDGTSDSDSEADDSNGTDDGTPGFGVVGALLALVVAGLVTLRRN